MLKVITMLWDANEKSFDFSRCYDESWVTKLYDGFARNLTKPYQFVLFTDRRREFGDRNVLQVLIDAKEPGYGSYIEPFRLDDPMILVGLDTVITGNIDHLAEFCLTSNVMALPVDPYHPITVCNGVALVPAGERIIYDHWSGENDMAWLRKQRWKTIDALFPNQVVSFKGTAKGYGLRDARIVFFHGEEKPHQLPHVGWINQHWRHTNEAPGETVPEGFLSSTVLRINANPNMPSALALANVDINSARDLPWVVPAEAHDRVAVIVGGGPSLKNDLPIIRGHMFAGHEVVALNNAANFLNQHDIVPDVQFILDPRPENIRFVKDMPAKGYILASQCDPSLFDYLNGKSITVLQPAIEGIYDHIPKTATVVSCGKTAGHAILNASFALGYREVHLYGYDSSDADDGNAHAYDQHETDPEKQRVEVMVAGKRFRSSYAMYVQAQMFESLALMLSDLGMIIHVHGDGLLPTIAREMTKATPDHQGETHGLQAVG